MMLAQKWNTKTHKYELYVLPVGCYLYTEDLEKKVACAQCSTQKTFGECYTSKEVHNKIGLGFPVCESCYADEWKRAKL